MSRDADEWQQNAAVHDVSCADKNETCVGFIAEIMSELAALNQISEEEEEEPPPSGHEGPGVIQPGRRPFSFSRLARFTDAPSLLLGRRLDHKGTEARVLQLIHSLSGKQLHVVGLASGASSLRRTVKENVNSL